MTNVQIRDLELLGYHYIPEEHLDELREIRRNNRIDVAWAVIQAYTLGTIHGKREDRNRRKK